MNNRSKNSEGFFEETVFLEEKIGDTENELKTNLIPALQRFGVERAYLTIVKHGNNSANSIAISLVHHDFGSPSLIAAVSEIFGKMFNNSNSLDIIFLSNEQESRVRQVACPFFSEMDYNKADFSIFSVDIRALTNERKCTKLRRLSNGHPDGYLLCRIEPPFFTKKNEMATLEINTVVLAARYEGESLFNSEFMAESLNVAIVLTNLRPDRFKIDASEMEFLGVVQVVLAKQILN
jgi:hypothetical protein